MLKSIKLDELVQAIRRAAQGETTLHPRVAARVIQEVQGARRDRQDASLFAALTEREMEILKLIANGLANSEIVAKLVISEYPVKGHVSNILSKLHLADRTQAAVLAWREGVMRRE